MTSGAAWPADQHSPQRSGAPIAISVLVPTIGRPEFIVDTIRSVLRQSFAELEILISDNAPAVATRGLLTAAGIRDGRIRIVERGTRVAFSEHMNLCLGEASGEFFMILSDDDQIAPTYIEDALQLVRAQPDVTVVLGRQHRVSGSDRGLFQREALGSLQVLSGERYLQGILDGTLVTGVLTQISMFARRLQALACGGFASYPDGSHADNRLLFALALQGSVALMPTPMYYRVYAQSFGLSTPYPALLEATRAYQRDQAALLAGTPALSPRARRLMLRSARISNFRLLAYRLLTIYRHRMSPIGWLGAVMKANALWVDRYPPPFN